MPQPATWPFRTMVLTTLVLVAMGACGGSDEGPLQLDAGGLDAPGADTRVEDARAADATTTLRADAGAFTRPIEVLSRTRLKGLFVRSPEGAQQVSGLYDTVLRTRCVITTAEDGKLRCLPPLPSSWEFGATVAYADQGCTELLLPEAGACGEAFGFKQTPAGRAVYRLGPARALTTGYSRSAGGVCEPIPVVGKFYALGAKLPATQFVERLTLVANGPRADRMSGLYDEFADGTRMRRSGLLADRDLGVTCRVRRASDGLPRCLPAFAASVSSAAFADDVCTVRPVVLNASEMPRHALISSGTGCASNAHIYEVGEKLGAGSLFALSDGQCVPLTPGTTLSYHRLGAEVPADRFARFEQVTITRGRLQEHWYRNEEGAADRVFVGLWDTTLGTECGFEPTSAGSRCVPPVGNPFFGDAGCSTTPLVFDTSTVCAVDAPAAALGSLYQGPWCARVAVPQRMGEAFTTDAGTVSYTPVVGGACSSSRVTAGLHRGTDMDPTLFSAGEQVVE